MQVFHNTRLALPWSAASERVKADQLRAAAEPFPLGALPDGALVLTAAVDVQGNRLEVLVMGWGPGLERWTVNAHVLPGDPADGAVWRDLDALLGVPLANSSGLWLVPEVVAIDTGAYTQDVYQYVRRCGRRVVGGRTQRTIAIKGANKPGRPIIATRPSKVDINQAGRVLRWGAELWLVGSDSAKDWLYSRLLVTTGEGAAHYSADLPDEWFDQLTAEAKRTRYVKGYKRIEWFKLNKGSRNEALDLMVYNLAAAHHLELHRKPAGWWEARRAQLHPPTRDMFAFADMPPPRVTQAPADATVGAPKPEAPPAPRLQPPEASPVPRPRPAQPRAHRPRSGSFLR